MAERSRKPLPPPPPRRPPPDQLSLLGDDAAMRRPRATPSHRSRKPRGPRFGEQFELFPAKVDVEALDPRRQLGPRTRVSRLWRVTIGGGEPHLVFRDRHGTYCEAHGVDCRAVRVVLSE